MPKSNTKLVAVKNYNYTVQEKLDLMMDHVLKHHSVQVCVIYTTDLNQEKRFYLAGIPKSNISWQHNPFNWSGGTRFETAKGQTYEEAVDGLFQEYVESLKEQKSKLLETVSKIDTILKTTT